MDEQHRSLTDEDVQAIADALEARMVSRFYTNLGQGVWAVAWKAIVVVVIFVACYGAYRGH
jgi:hypothetical protein